MRPRIFSHTVFNQFIEAEYVVDKVCVRKKCEYLCWEGQEIIVGREKCVPRRIDVTHVAPFYVV